MLTALGLGFRLGLKVKSLGFRGSGLFTTEALS